MKEKAKDIVERAATLFMRHGLRSISMDEIASYCGVSKKNLYANFTSKQYLIETILQKLILKTDKYIRLCPDISPNAVKEIENFSEHMLDVLEVLTPKFIRELKKYYPEAYARLIVFKDRSILPYLECCLKRGIIEGVFRSDIVKKNAGRYYCLLIQNVFEGEGLQEDVLPIIENINELFVHSILNSKGLKLLSIDKQTEDVGQRN